jgi:hypothetical protein
MPAFQTQGTPNPNSIKIVTDGPSFIDEGMESFNSAQEAEDHPLGHRLFSLPGIANVFMLPQFVTVTKHPATKWGDLMPKVEQVLQSYFEERDAA